MVRSSKNVRLTKPRNLHPARRDRRAAHRLHRIHHPGPTGTVCWLYMSFPDPGRDALDGEEASDEQQRRLVRRVPASPNERRPTHVRSQALAQAQLHTQLLAQQVHAQLQAQIPNGFLNYGSITLISNPVQYNSELSHGFVGDIAMCKSLSLSSFRGICQSLLESGRSADSSPFAAHPTVSLTYELTVGIFSAPNGILGHKQQQMFPNGGNEEQESTSPFESPTSRPSSDEAPPEFIDQPPAWFREGRCFSIWAPSENEIHKRKFILLDSFNKEGRGVRVDVLDNVELQQIAESTTSYHNRVLLKASSRGGHRPSSSRSTGSSQQERAMTRDPVLLGKVDQKFLHASLDEYAQM